MPGIVDVLLDEDSTRVVAASVEDVAKVDPAERLGPIQSCPATLQS